MELFENLNVIDLSKCEDLVRSFKPSHIMCCRGQIGIVVYDPLKGAIEAYGISPHEVEQEARENADYVSEIPNAKIFIFGKVDPRVLTPAIRILEEQNFDKNNLWVKIRNNLRIDPKNGEFSFSHSAQGLNIAETPDVLKDASFSFQRFLNHQEFFDALIDSARESEGGGDLDKNHIEYVTKLDWRGISDTLPVLKLYTSASSEGLNHSFAEELKNYEMIRQVFEQLDGKPNVAGHIVWLDGCEYVLLNSPQNSFGTIDRLEMPTPPVLFQRSNEYLLPVKEQFKEMIQGNDNFILVRKSDWQKIFECSAPIAED